MKVGLHELEDQIDVFGVLSAQNSQERYDVGVAGESLE